MRQYYRQSEVVQFKMFIFLLPLKLEFDENTVHSFMGKLYTVVSLNFPVEKKSGGREGRRGVF